LGDKYREAPSNGEMAGSGRHSRGSRSRIASYSAPGHGGRGNAATARSKPRTAGSFPVKNRATNPPSAFHRSKSSAFRVPTHSPVRADRDGSWPRDSGAGADKRRNRRVANRAKHASDKASVPGSIFTQDTSAKSSSKQTRKTRSCTHQNNEIDSFSHTTWSGNQEDPHVSKDGHRP
jgi:hypothetical protein